MYFRKIVIFIYLYNKQVVFVKDYKVIVKKLDLNNSWTNKSQKHHSLNYNDVVN